MKSREWYSQMDGLRFVAIFFVLVAHFAFFIGIPINAGFFGVDLFFVISGFLITEGLLFDKNSERPLKRSFAKFYFRRFLRIFPIYYLVLVIALFTYAPFKTIAPWAFSYTINYYTAFTGNMVPEAFGHLWSLSLEEQFYIFWPLVILLIPRKVLLITLCLITVFSLTCFIVEHDYMGLPGRMYSLCLGAILATVKQEYFSFFKKDVVKKAGFIFLFSFILFWIHTNLGLSLLSFGLVYICTNNAYAGIFKSFLENRKIMYVGKISYGVYLYHLPLGYLLTYYFFDPLWLEIDFDALGGLKFLRFHSWIIKLPLYSLLTIAVASLSYVYIEKPLLLLKQKIT